jgi:hypothetical protein
MNRNKDYPRENKKKGGKMKKTNLLGIVVLSLIIYLSGCMTASFRDLTRKAFSAPEFTTYEMETGGIAFLPTIAAPEYSRSIEVGLIQSFQKFHPGIKAISGSETRTFLQNEGLVEEYSQMIDRYYRTSIIDKSVVVKMGQAVKARYLIYTRLLKYDEYKNPKGDQTIYELSVKAEVWDSRNSEVVWDATGNVRVIQTILDKPVTFDEIAVKVCDSLMMRLP